jgi:hypothetical protein
VAACAKEPSTQNAAPIDKTQRRSHRKLILGSSGFILGIGLHCCGLDFLDPKATLVASAIAAEQDMTSEASNDTATALATEFEMWFRNLSEQAVLPRAFTGVTKDGKQAVIILTGLPLTDVQRRNFLIWLCRNEEFVAYAYGTHVGIAESSSGPITEGLDIYASSGRYDVSRVLEIKRSDQSNKPTFRLITRHAMTFTAGSKNLLFFGLQRATDQISDDDQKSFKKLWAELKQKAMWRQR